MVSKFLDPVRFHVRSSYPNLRSLIVAGERRNTAIERRPICLPGHSPATVTLITKEAEEKRQEIIVRDVDVHYLCQSDSTKAIEHLGLILSSRAKDSAATTTLQAITEKRLQELALRHSKVQELENRFLVPSTSHLTYDETAISHKGCVLLKLNQLGYPVPDFVILSSALYTTESSERQCCVRQALDVLESLTGQNLNSSNYPLAFAIRSALPHYYPGIMPTYLNAGITEQSLGGLAALYGEDAALRMYFNNLRNILHIVDRETYISLNNEIKNPDKIRHPETLVATITESLKKIDPLLTSDAFRQTLTLIEGAYGYFEDNQDLILTLSRGQKHYPAFILQKMVCTVRHDDACAGVLSSRHSRAGKGSQVEIAHNIFGEDIMTGSEKTEQISFMRPVEIKETLPAIYHFAPRLKNLESEFEAPVTLEFAVDATERHQLFALLQLDNTAMTGRAAFVSAVDMHQAGIISRKRVTELIHPYHIKQIESDAIDTDSIAELKKFSSGNTILPRAAVSARIYFSAEAALQAKKRGEHVCFCKKTFKPDDIVVMQELDAILGLTPAAIHMVTICQSFGIPSLLNLEKNGVLLNATEKTLVNETGDTITEGEWVTISSRRQALFKGRARFKAARLLRYIRGEEVAFEENEKEAYQAMAYAYRYYHQLVRSLKLDQITTLNEVIRLVNLELRGKETEAKNLVNGWFDSHETLYAQEVLKSEMGDHLNQHRVFELLTLERKIRLLKIALQITAATQTSGYSAGAFMLGRFLTQPLALAFWKAFAPCEIALLINEWILFEKYIRILYAVGERRVARVRKQILNEGLSELVLEPKNLESLTPLKLSRLSLHEVARSIPVWCDPQTREVLKILREPYGKFFDFSTPWSLKRLEKLCETENIAVPAATDC